MTVPRSPSSSMSCSRIASGISALRAIAAIAAAAAIDVTAALEHIREQRELAGPLDRRGDLALVAPTGAGDATRADLALLGHEPAQAGHVLVVNLLDLVSAVRTWLAPAAPRPTLLLSPADWFAAAARFCHKDLAELALERNIVVAGS